MSVGASRVVDRVTARLKMRQLRLLIAVGEQGSIQNAAKAVGVSQPAATTMIQDLERDFAVKLFDRTNRGVAPTIFGAALIRHGKLIVAQLSNAAQELDDLAEGARGRVVIGALLAAAPALLPAAIDRLRADRPKVAIKIVEGTNAVLMPALSSGEIDMVVGRLPSRRHRAELVQEAFFDERVVIVVGPQHPLADVPDVEFGQLAPFGWILPPVETTLRRQVDQFFVNQQQFAPVSAIESVSYLANRALLRRHDLIGVMPAHVAALDVERGLLAQLDWAVPFGAGPIGVSHRGESGLSPAGAAFLDALRRSAQALAAARAAV